MSEEKLIKVTKVALVGRPNVGKSSLFNRLVKKRIAIVHDEPGVTRDCLKGYFDYSDEHRFEVVDTGGLFHEHSYADKILSGAKEAIEEADVILLVVDAQVGLTKEDLFVKEWLYKQKFNKPIVALFNKSEGKDEDLKQFGFEHAFAVSAIHGSGIYELQEAVCKWGRMQPLASISKEPIRVAVVGRPNVGKSTLFNTLFGEERSLVSQEIGTTRDSIVESIGEFCWIDTAGIRKKSREETVVEKFAALRTDDAIEKSDVCILVIDVTQGITDHDKRIAAKIVAAGKGCILFCNKWDLIKETRMEHVLSSLKKDPTLISFELVVGSAKTGRKVESLAPFIKTAYANNHKRISTGQLNRWLSDLLRRQSPPSVKGRPTKISYMTQVSIAPPKFILSCNHKDVPTSYIRYLENRFRSEQGFIGTPLFIYPKER